jgi:monoamine oxidase
VTDTTYDTVVLGGGMAGLAAAELSLEAGRRVVLVEAAPTVGGLARASKALGLGRRAADQAMAAQAVARTNVAKTDHPLAAERG